MIDALIVGGGLFGQIIAAELRRIGQTVLVLDRGEKLAGSKPAACLMKPSWFSGMERSQRDAALETLGRLYDVRSLVFETGPIKSSVLWIDPATILAPLVIPANVKAVRPGFVMFEDGSALEARNIVVAAGIWTEKLLPGYVQKGQMGAAILAQGVASERRIIRPWAPYKQLVGFHRGDGYWAGDGSAILPSNWTEAREAQTVARELDFIEDATGTRPEAFKTLRGIRPYHGSKPALVDEVAPGLWVATGGAKNGTIAAGWAAHRIAQALT